MLLISDLHLTDKAIDAYRWQVFDFVKEYYEKTEDKFLFILGDLTDSKDRHSSVLVNLIVKALVELRDMGMEIYILMGNHDYIDPGQPFFGFLDKFEFINYIKRPTYWSIQGEPCLFLPHTRNPRKDWQDFSQYNVAAKCCKLVFMHQSIIGSVTSNGYEMKEGLTTKYLRNKFKGKIFSGDIHVPQNCGNVTYVGTPYSVRFNDHFRGRAIALVGYPPKGWGKAAGISIPPSNLLSCDLYPGLPGRRTVEIREVDDLQRCNADPGDQIKVRVMLGDDSEWDNYKVEIEEACKELEFELCSLQVVPNTKLPLRRNHFKNHIAILDPKTVLENYGKKKSIDKTKMKIGRRILNET